MPKRRPRTHRAQSPTHRRGTAIAMFSSGKSRLAPSTANALLGKRENSLGDLDQFLKEEVEAAQMMYDAFRAIKGADGSVIDTRDWSEGTAIRVKVRSPATRPLQFRRIARCRISRIIRVVTTQIGRR